MRDAISRNIVKRVLSPAVLTNADTAQVGQIIDHQGYDSAEYIILTGSLSDANATFTVLLEEGDVSNLSDAAAVDDADMVSQTIGTAPETAAAFTFTHDDQVRKLAYVGIKRYTRLTITPSGNDSGSANLAACCVLGMRAPGTAATTQPTA